MSKESLEGFSNPSRGLDFDKPVINVSARMKAPGSDEIGPYFQQQKKGPDGEWKPVGDTFTCADGDIVYVDIFKGEYKGKATFSMRLGIDTGNQIALIRFLSNSVSESIINTLAATEGLYGSTLQISLGVNKRGYASAWLLINGERSEWAVGPETFKDWGADEWINLFKEKVASQFPGNELEDDKPLFENTEEKTNEVDDDLDNVPF